MDSERERALELSRGLRATPKNLDRVGAEVGVSAARWAFSQWELRKRARAKFARAEEMLFDRAGLEMASHEEVAWFHATRFPAGSRVADLTAGIGSDCVALARNGKAIAFEIDAARAELARHNLSIHGLEAVVVERDCLSLEWEFGYAYADPARRAGGARLSNPSQFEPNLDELLRRMRPLSLGIVKLSPMLPDSYLSSLEGPIEFVSHRGDCKEALLSVGKELNYPDESSGRSVCARHVESGSALGSRDRPPLRSSTPNVYLYDADPAAIRANALGTLCEEFGLATLGDSNGYLTGNRLVRSPWLRPYRVLWHGQGDRKATQSTIRQLGGNLVEVKTRGVRERAEAILGSYRRAGDRRLVLAVWPEGRGLRHALLEPNAQSL